MSVRPLGNIINRGNHSLWTMHGPLPPLNTPLNIVAGHFIQSELEDCVFTKHGTVSINKRYLITEKTPQLTNDSN